MMGFLLFQPPPPPPPFCHSFGNATRTRTTNKKPQMIVKSIVVPFDVWFINQFGLKALSIQTPVIFCQLGNATLEEP